MHITNNNCTENKKGIIGERVPYSSFIDNNCNSSDTSMDLSEAKGVTIRDNNFGKRGIKLYEQHREKFLDYTVENNLANNKEIGFFINIQNQTIDEEQFGQVFIASCFNLLRRASRSICPNCSCSDSISILYHQFFFSLYYNSFMIYLLILHIWLLDF